MGKKKKNPKNRIDNNIQMQLFTWQKFFKFLWAADDVYLGRLVENWYQQQNK